MLVAQSFHIFNRYGKDEHALAPMNHAFLEDLEPYSETEITAAFKAWRQRKSGMPAPADIINEIKGKQRNNLSGRLKKFQHWEGSLESYFEYLEREGKLSENIIRIDGKLQLKPGYNPPWTVKDWREAL